jgi:hypothetical protein
MGGSKQLPIGILVGVLIGAALFFGFTQLSAFSNDMAAKNNQIRDLHAQVAFLETQIVLLQSENSQLRANNTLLASQISQISGSSNFTETKTGKAIQIQSVSAPASGVLLTVFVQNVGDSSVNLVNGQCLYVNGALIPTANPALPTLDVGATTSIPATVASINHGDVFAVKVTTQDGAFSQMTFTVP